MRVLYVDNFRGFKNTYIPLTDVNFLVGENSAGKTSILALLSLFTSMRFWLEQTFDVNEVSFGHFSDIVSVNSRNRKYFRIGIIEDYLVKTKEGNKSRINAHLLTYTDFAGKPELAAYSRLLLGSSIHIKRSGNSYKYKIEESIDLGNIAKFREEIFPGWVKIHNADNAGYKKIKNHFFSDQYVSGSQISKSSPLALLLSISREIKEGMAGTTDYFASQASIIHELAWLAPIRSKPRRTYDEYKYDFSPEGDHTPYLIKKYLSKSSEARSFKKFLEKFGKDSGLFKSLEVRQYSNSDTAPFELDIILDEKALGVNNVGYGVSQALPVVVEVLIRSPGVWFAIQQPEVHLHPKAQAAMGDMIFDLSVREGKSFIIETHSDFTIDRFRMNFRKNTARTKKPHSQILFFERTKLGNKVHPLFIDESGDLPTNQPTSYRKFFIKEELNNIGI